MSNKNLDHHYIAIDTTARVTYVTPPLAVDTIVFLGVGQTGKNLTKISRLVPDNVATVGAFPYHRFTHQHLEKESVHCVLKVIETLGTKKYHVIAESQAAPAVVAAAYQYPDHFRSVTLLQPLGFNKSALGDTSDQRYHELLRRSRLFWKHSHQSLRIAGNRTTLYEIIKYSLLSLRRIRSDYTIGANQDVSEQAIKLAYKLPVTIYAAEYDSLFPYSEIAPTVAGSRIVLVKSSGETHRNRATPGAIAELQEVIASLAS